MSSGILKLQEAGKLHSFKEKWWKERKGGGKCVDDSKKSSAVTELSLANVGGVFVVLLGGLGLASVVAVMEFFFKAKKMAKEDSVRSLVPFTRVDNGKGLGLFEFHYNRLRAQGHNDKKKKKTTDCTAFLSCCCVLAL